MNSNHPHGNSNDPHADSHERRAKPSDRAKAGDAHAASGDPYGSPDARYSYQSPLVDRLRASGHELTAGRLTIRLAEKLGFCWGVDRAVAMVWDAIRKNPGRRLWLLNQIIHNPKVNEDFRKSGVRFVFGKYAEPGGFDRVRREDLAIIPAFSAEVEHLQKLKQTGCEIVDTTCPWVEKPHRRVLKYIEDGFTTLIHGHPGHDETRATCSLVESRGGRFVVLRGLEDCDALCAYLRGAATRAQLEARFAPYEPDAASDAAHPEHRQPHWSRGFDPERDLERVGMVNQTTMLASESREIARRVAATIAARESTTISARESATITARAGARGSARFRDFDTICPATQENQDAVIQLTSAAPPDLFLVIGGYDSSNTASLLRAANARRGSFHVQGPASIDPAAIRHRDPATGREIATRDWLPAGPVTVAVSAGASTPDTELAEVIRRLCAAAEVAAPGDAIETRSASPIV